MYCSINCSRAARSPSSWYRRSRILSLSAMSRDLLGQVNELAVDVNVVDRRLEHTAQAQGAVLLLLDLVEQRRGERTDARLERPLSQCHLHRDVPGLGVGTVEDRVERDLEVLEVLDRQVEAHREPAEHEMRDTMEVPFARDRERDLVSHGESP